jgi:hypothetical protein
VALIASPDASGASSSLGNSASFVGIAERSGLVGFGSSRGERDSRLEGCPSSSCGRLQTAVHIADRESKLVLEDCGKCSTVGKRGYQSSIAVDGISIGACQERGSGALYSTISGGVGGTADGDTVGRAVDAALEHTPKVDFGGKPRINVANGNMAGGITVVNDEHATL